SSLRSSFHDESPSPLLIPSERGINLSLLPVFTTPAARINTPTVSLSVGRHNLILVPLLSNDNTTVLVVNVNRPSVLAHAGPHLIPVVQNIELHVFRHAVLVRMSFY